MKIHKIHLFGLLAPFALVTSMQAVITMLQYTTTFAGTTTPCNVTLYTDDTGGVHAYKRTDAASNTIVAYGGSRLISQSGAMDNQAKNQHYKADYDRLEAAHAQQNTPGERE